ncbi:MULTISPECIES: hypothetical protein [Planktothricoides]|uniref:Uncharacterized protein n=2 Tax=Planktothricoides raciborskii TaxID=132608 RepID=A0AAU8JH76_9CYAN|nr:MULTISPECIES: hypothetical protein [Planktothricoides]KOR34403.1 hypothetical protein AM228_24230 [Planktothricoides sp. SR001]MBD2546911.1 hypothetical protein [Planktothricoides raciborskii FACHB-1370]MBD2584582.1 hypothetical protein [Planktothricoides raciborskii FACHB-1261]
MTFVSGVKEFIQSWDDCFVEVTETDVFATSPQGNINSEGTSACYNSAIFPKYHRYFKKSLEAGIRELAIALIRKYNCITYSSCQGHATTNDAVMRQRYVAILPRTPQEYERFFNLFHHLAKLTNQQIADNSVKVAIGDDPVESEDGVMPGITLFFVADHKDETLYFHDVEIAYQKVLEIVLSHSEGALRSTNAPYEV